MVPPPLFSKPWQAIVRTIAMVSLLKANSTVTYRIRGLRLFYITASKKTGFRLRLALSFLPSSFRSVPAPFRKRQKVPYSDAN